MLTICKRTYYQAQQGQLEKQWGTGHVAKQPASISEVNDSEHDTSPLYTVATAACAAEAFCDSCANRLHCRHAYSVHTAAGRRATVSITVLTWRALRCSRSNAAPPNTALAASATYKQSDRLDRFALAT